MGKTHREVLMPLRIKSAEGRCEKCIKNHGKPTYITRNLRMFLHIAEHGDLEKIHIYHLNGTEVNYDASHMENNICEGTIL